MKRSFTRTFLFLLFCSAVVVGRAAAAASVSRVNAAGTQKLVFTGIAAPPPATLEQANGDLNLAASTYINFGPKDGSGGYGFRDNAGTIQVKNAGGSWVDIATGANRRFKHARGMDYGKQISPIIKAIQEQQEEIKKQDAEIRELRAEVELLRHRGASALPKSNP